MKQQIALAYAIASLASAIAVITVVGSMVGWSDTAQSEPLTAPADAQVAWARDPPLDPAVVADPPEEIVYVDQTGAPLVGSPRGRHDDDDDDYEREDDDREHHDRGGHRRERDDD